MPTIAQALQQAQMQLQALSSTDARREAELLLCHVLQRDLTHLIAWPEKPLETCHAQQFSQLVARRTGGEPVAYIKGEKEFWSRRFHVDARCLIPRPETELLIEFALQRFQPQQPLSVLDAGTGSGAIAVTLSCECPRWQLTASDIDADALAVAQHNARRHRAGPIRFVQSNWLDAIDTRFDLIVSNPPYIASEDPHLEQGDLRFEPAHALVSGDDGLDAIRQLCRQAGDHLRSGGWLLFEHGYDQQKTVHQLLADNGFHHIEQLHDYAGQPRLSAAQWQ